MQRRNSRNFFSRRMRDILASRESRRGRQEMRAITLVNYDPAWPALFQSRCEAIAALLGQPADIQHIGSTSVPAFAQSRSSISTRSYSRMTPGCLPPNICKRTAMSSTVVSMATIGGSSPRMRRPLEHVSISACSAIPRTVTVFSFAIVFAPIRKRPSVMRR